MAVLIPSSNFLAVVLSFLLVLVTTPTFAQVLCPPLSAPATTNQDLNSFMGCNTIQGDVEIGFRNCSIICQVTTLSSLSLVQDIQGSLSIQCCSQLIDLVGISALGQVRGSVVIYFNQILSSINGFASLTSVQGNFEVSQNQMLQSITGFGNFREISGYLQIDRNVALWNLDGFRSLTTIGGSALVAGHALNILYNTNLTDLSGFRDLTDINFGTVHIEGNTALCYAGHPLWSFGSYPLREADGNLGIDWRTKLRITAHWQYTWDVVGGGYPTLLIQNNAQPSLCASAASCDGSCDMGAGCLGPNDPALCGTCLQEGSLDTCDFVTQPTPQPTEVPLAVVYGVVFSVVGVITLAVLGVVVFCFVKLCGRLRETRKGSFDVDVGVHKSESQEYEIVSTSFDNNAAAKKPARSSRTDGNIASMAEPTTGGGGGRSGKKKGQKKSGLDNVIVISSYQQKSESLPSPDAKATEEKPPANHRVPPPANHRVPPPANHRVPLSQPVSQEPAATKKQRKLSEPVLVSSYRKRTSVTEDDAPSASTTAAVTGASHERRSIEQPRVGAADIPMNFPVAQLKLAREIGGGDLGKVFRAEAKKLTVGQKKTTVMVKQLKDGATKQEKAAFIRPVEAMKLLQHPNVLSLLGVCMDGPSIMVMLEYCALGNFKTYLVQKRQDTVSFKRNGQLLRSALDMAKGLMYLHTKNIAHNDFAVRNCMVMGDGAVKLGDYGLTRQTFKEDYYSRAPNQKAWPIRWMAPEQIVIQGRSVLDSLPVSMQGNIWSFGVALWEVCSFAQWPYDDLSNEEVIQTVKVFGKCVLENPLKGDTDFAPLFDIMSLCWQEADMRPTMADIVSQLKVLKEGEAIDGAAAGTISQQVAATAGAPRKTSQTGSVDAKSRALSQTSQTGSTQVDPKRRALGQTSQTGSTQADAKKRPTSGQTAKGNSLPKSASSQTSQTSSTGTATRRLSDQHQYKPRRPAPKKPPAVKSSTLPNKKRKDSAENLLLAPSQQSQEEEDKASKATHSRPPSQDSGPKKSKHRQRTPSTEPLVFENPTTSTYDDGDDDATLNVLQDGEQKLSEHHNTNPKSKANIKPQHPKKAKTYAKYHFEDDDDDFEDSLCSSPIQLDLSLPEGDEEMLPFQMPHPTSSSVAVGSKDDFIIEPPEDFSQTSVDNEFDRQQKLQLAADEQEKEPSEEEGEGGFPPLAMKKFGAVEDLADQSDERTNAQDDDEEWDDFPVPDQNAFDEFDHRDALEEDDIPNVVYDEDVAALIW